MKDLDRKPAIRVVQFLQCWLPQTMTWLHGHLSSLPSNIESQIVCQWTNNLDQFPASGIVSLDLPPTTPTVFARLQRRLGVMNEEDQRHLALLEEVIQATSPRVIHSHFGQCGWAAAKIARKYNLKHIVSFYGLDLSYLPRQDSRWRTRYRQMSDMVDLVLCEGPHMARCLAELGVSPAKTRLFRLGIDLVRIPFVPRTSDRHAPIRFLIAGSFREKKGIPYAVEALGLFSKQHPDIQITIIGDSGGNELEERVKREIFAMIDRYGLSAKAHFLGYQPYDVLIQELYKHHIFVSPSVTASNGDTEGGAPVSIIEAAASGMPVASTTHCDIPFMLSEENKSYLVPERDSLALCNAIERLVQLPEWRPMVTANRRLVESELNVKRQADRLAMLYRECSFGLAGKHTAADLSSQS